MLLAIASPGHTALPLDGSWQLQISGHHSFIYGEPGFGGGIRIPWEVVIQFQIRGGDYSGGSGSARWLDRIEALSRPSDWFHCGQVAGTYLDSNLAMHATPRVRFSAFPVAGDLADGRIRLRPGYRPPGNYLAVTYECSTDNPRAYNWFPTAERGVQVFGKRQDAERDSAGDQQQARVREVAALPPEGALELPLEHGWVFVQGASDEISAVTYRLQRLDD